MRAAVELAMMRGAVELSTMRGAVELLFSAGVLGSWPVAEDQGQARELGVIISR